MSQQFAVVLKDKRYLIHTIESEEELTNESKMELAVEEFKKAIFDPSVIDFISDLETIKNDKNYIPVSFIKNNFVIFLKDDPAIIIETDHLKEMTLEEKMNFAIQDLKKSGINPDKISHIGDKEELNIKIKSTSLGLIVTLILALGALYVLFKT